MLATYPKRITQSNETALESGLEHSFVCNTGGLHANPVKYRLHVTSQDLMQSEDHGGIENVACGVQLSSDVFPDFYLYSWSFFWLLVLLFDKTTMDGTSALSTVGSILTATVKIAEKVFEIYAVDTQAKAVLQTVNQVSEDLRVARTLRRQKSDIFTSIEKKRFDETFAHTDAAIHQVAALAEHARADMNVSGGKVRPSTRLLFVLRDSPNIQ